MITIDELKAAGKQLPGLQMDEQRRLALRDAILSAARDSGQQRTGRRPVWVAGAVIAAAAAVLAVYLARGQEQADSGEHLAAVVSSQGADFEHQSAAGPAGRDEVVRLETGSLQLAVDEHRKGDRFRVVTSDAEVEGVDTVFEIGVESDRLSRVVVHSGRVEIRIIDQPPVILGPGGRWNASVIERGELTLTGDDDDDDSGSAGGATDGAGGAAEADEASGAADDTAAAEVTEREPAVAIARVRPREIAPAREREAVRDEGLSDSDAVEDESDSSSKVPDAGAGLPGDEGEQVLAPRSPTPAEVAFDVGYRAVKRGNYGEAISELEVAIAAAGNGPLVEDARYWLAVALARAGRNPRARAVMSDYLKYHGRSSRAGEVAVMYGWVVLEAGELDRAEALFKRAVSDPLARVRKSARAGLEAVERER